VPADFVARQDTPKTARYSAKSAMYIEAGQTGGQAVIHLLQYAVVYW
jgi:hypothetical protein